MPAHLDPRGWGPIHLGGCNSRAFWLGGPLDLKNITAQRKKVKLRAGHEFHLVLLCSRIR